MTEVRIATLADWDEVYRLLMMGHAENGILPLSQQKVVWWMGRVLAPEHLDPRDLGPRGAIGVIDTIDNKTGKPSGRLQGLAFVVLGSFWYSEHRHLEEFIVFVDPAHRASPNAMRLVKWMKEQSRLLGLPLMTGICSLQPGVERKVELYKRMLPQAGSFFVFNPATLSSSMATVH